MEPKDVVDVGATETVYALCVVANDTYFLSLVCELVDDCLLGEVGVLILIHEYILKPLGILAPDVLVVGEQDVDVHKQVIKVHGICLTASLAVSGVNVLDSRHLVLHVGSDGTLRIGIFASCEKMVLCHADAVSHCGYLINLVIEVHFLDNGLDE